MVTISVPIVVLGSPVLDSLEVRKALRPEILRVKPGDILLVTVGLGAPEMGDAQGPWIPTSEDLIQVSQDIERSLPEGVKALTLHMGVKVERVIRPYSGDPELCPKCEARPPTSDDYLCEECRG